MCDAFGATGSLPTCDVPVAMIFETVSPTGTLTGSPPALAAKGSLPDVVVSGSLDSPSLKGGTE